MVTFIPNTEPEVVERPTFWDLRRNYSLEAFDCWTSAPPQTQCPKCCQKCSSSPYVNHEAFPKRPSIRPTSSSSSSSKKVLEILPDYTDDEQEAFPTPIVKPPSYPSGSMTLPKPAVKKHASPAQPATSEAKVTFKGLPPEVKKATDNNSPTPVTKPNESGESDPGYESDSSKSKPSEDSQGTTNSPQQPKQQQKSQQQQQQQQQQQHQNKACTLPRRSAKVSSSVQPPSSTLDRRKLRNLADSEAGVTVEIISPIRVCQTVFKFFILSGTRCRKHIFY